MPDYDPSNQNTTGAGKLPNLGQKPTIAELTAAIAGSAHAAKYPAAHMRTASKNDLIYICRTHGIAVAGLPGV
jgi:hypothetical protein